MTILTSDWSVKHQNAGRSIQQIVLGRDSPSSTITVFYTSIDNISILNLQETEIPGEVSTRLLEIHNYVLEVEKTLSKRRVATYIHKNLNTREDMT